MKKPIDERLIEEEDAVRDRIAEQMAGVMFVLGFGVYFLLVALVVLALFVAFAGALVGR